MKKGENRPYSETELSKYRSDKRRPRRTIIRVVDDLGNKSRVRKWTTPKPKFEEHQIPKTASGHWEDVYKRNGLWIRHSKISDRYFMFAWVDEDYQYIGELEQPDLWKLLIELGKSFGAFREELHMQQNCKRYTKYVLNLRKMNSHARRDIQ